MFLTLHKQLHFYVTLRYAEISMLFGLATSYFVSQEQLYCDRLDKQYKKKEMPI
jgi:hypothetical protein